MTVLSLINKTDVALSSPSSEQAPQTPVIKNPIAIVILVICIGAGLAVFGIFASRADTQFQTEKNAQEETQRQERATQLEAQRLENQKRLEEGRARRLQQPAVTYPANPQQRGAALPPVGVPSGYCAGTGLMPLFGENGAQCCQGLQLIDGLHCSLPLNVHPTQSPCIDSDSGITIGVWGTVSGGIYENQAYDHGLFTDYCAPSTNILIEFYCSNNEILLIQQPCLQGTVCRYGACIPSN